MDKFLIAPLNSGLQTDQKPFLIPDDAFAELNNAYIFRGRVRKRFGATFMNTSQPAAVQQLYSKLAISLGPTVAGALAGTVPGAIFAIGQQFSIGTAIYTVVTAGAVQPMLQTTATTTATFSTTNGAFNFVGAPAGTVYWYPNQPVMGITLYQQAALNDEQTVAFDTQFAYFYTAGHWERLGTGLWTGSNSQFVWGISARGAAASDRYLYATNDKETNAAGADGLKFWTGAAWTTYTPTVSAGVVLRGCLATAYFKDRLVVLNTLEGAAAPAAVTNFSNRIRWSKANDPVTAATSFLVTTSNNSGSFLDIPTTEAITSCNIIKDRLIVFCEQSTWELVYTGNQAFPFRIQQINRELGIESTFSSIVFDKVILGIGNVGIHACNGANVERIDQKIPYQVFQINNTNNGIVRVQGVRDYYNELVYWAFPQAGRADTFPSKVLVFNYRTGSWATLDDSITAFGYFQNQTRATWASLRQSWTSTASSWDSATFQTQFKNVLAGNQQGVCFVIEPDVSRNSNALSITDISYATAFDMPELKIINHNLRTGDYIYLDNIQGTSSFLNGNIYQVTRRVSVDIVRIEADNNQLRTYNGGGTVALVSQISIKTKQYSFYAQDMYMSYTHRVAFNVNRTSYGEVAIDFYVSSGDLQMVTEGEETGSLVCNGTLETRPYTTVPIEAQQERLWHYVYLQAEGEYLQYRIYLNDGQMRDPQVSMQSDFQLNAITMYAQKTVKI